MDEENFVKKKKGNLKFGNSIYQSVNHRRIGNPNNAVNVEVDAVCVAVSLSYVLFSIRMPQGLQGSIG